MKHKRMIWAAVCVGILAVAALVWAGTPQLLKYGARLSDEGAAHSTPPSGYLDLYVNGDTLYTINDSGTTVALSAGTGERVADWVRGRCACGRTIEHARSGMAWRSAPQSAIQGDTSMTGILPHDRGAWGWAAGARRRHWRA